MTTSGNHWRTRGANWGLAGVCALSLNGCIFFGTEYCDPAIDARCAAVVLGAGAPGDGDVSSGGMPTGGRTSEGSGGAGTGGNDGSGARNSSGGDGGADGGSGGASTGGEASTGGAANGGDTGTGGASTGGSGTGGSSGTGRLIFSEVQIGNGSTWVELYNISGLAVDTTNLWISSAASAAPNYSDVCSLAGIGLMNDKEIAIVTQGDGPCPGGVSLCVTSCYDLVATAGRSIQLFEGSSSDSLTMIKYSTIPSPNPGVGQTHHAVEGAAEGTFDRATASPGDPW